MGDHDVWPVDPSGLLATGSAGNDLLALNNAHARELSWLEPERFV
jgi:predicted GNAT superfamily acetyltransferase